MFDRILSLVFDATSNQDAPNVSAPADVVQSSAPVSQEASTVVLPLTPDAQVSRSDDDEISQYEQAGLCVSYTTSLSLEAVVASIRDQHAAAGYNNGDIIDEVPDHWVWNADFPAHHTELIGAYRFLDIRVLRLDAG